MESLFTKLNNKFKSLYNETMKSLQIFKFCRQMNKNAEAWMGRLRLVAVECHYKEINRQLKDQFIHKLNDTNMLAETIRELFKPLKVKL